jgi:RNA polymerase sigma-70 factor (ECF subfamily)
VPTDRELAAELRSKLCEIGSSAELEQSPELERALGTFVRAGHCAYPDLALDDSALLACLAKVLGSGPVGAGALERLCAADFRLAMACAAEQPRAVAEFRRRFDDVIRRAAMRVRSDPDFVEEARQRVYERLLVRTPNAQPRIAAYAGRGVLEVWVRVAASRLSLDLAQCDQGKVEAADSQLEQLAKGVLSEHDPELFAMKQEHIGVFRQVFGEAMETLTSEERVVLRLKLLEGVNIDRIGVMFNVHRATVARWISRAQEKLAAELRSRLAARLDLSESELSSLIRLVDSQLDVSLSHWLRSEQGNTAT